MSGVENVQMVTKPAVEERVRVVAWPDEVQVVVLAREGNLTPDEAEELSPVLLKAAEQARRLDWSGDGDDAELVERAAA